MNQVQRLRSSIMAAVLLCGSVPLCVAETQKWPATMRRQIRMSR